MSFWDFADKHMGALFTVSVLFFLFGLPIAIECTEAIVSAWRRK